MASWGPFKIVFFFLVNKANLFCYVKRTLSFYCQFCLARSVFCLSDLRAAPLAYCVENYKTIKGGAALKLTYSTNHFSK